MKGGNNSVPSDSQTLKVTFCNLIIDVTGNSVGCLIVHSVIHIIVPKGLCEDWR